MDTYSFFHQTSRESTFIMKRNNDQIDMRKFVKYHEYYTEKNTNVIERLKEELNGLRAQES